MEKAKGNGEEANKPGGAVGGKTEGGEIEKRGRERDMERETGGRETTHLLPQPGRGVRLLLQSPPEEQTLFAVVRLAVPLRLLLLHHHQHPGERGVSGVAVLLKTQLSLHWSPRA